MSSLWYAGRSFSPEFFRNFGLYHSIYTLRNPQIMAKQSEIRFSVELDDKNFIDKIFWRASDGPEPAMSEAKAVAMSVWDHANHETLRIDLWTQDMPMQDMKRLCLDTISGLADTVQAATGDEFIAQKMHQLCEEIIEHLRKEGEQQKQ